MMSYPFHEYLVSENGDVMKSEEMKNGEYFPKVTIYTHKKTKRSYTYVLLQVNKKKKRFNVAYLVAELFIRPRNGLGEMIEFIDGNSSNFHYTNLRWIKKVSTSF